MASSESTYGAVSVDATAEIIAAARPRRESIIIQNVHATQVLYVGNDANVTSSNGLKVIAGESVRLETKSAIWGVGSGAATDTRFFEEF
jgi:hypothetical protein